MTDLGPLFAYPLNDENWRTLSDLLDNHAHGYMLVVADERMAYDKRLQSLSWLLVYKFIQGERADVSIEFLLSWHAKLVG